MRLHPVCLFGLVALLLGAGPARADWDPQSTAAAPCGTGEPEPGHVLREIASDEGVNELTLSVRQAGSRLCYVLDDKAEAPVIRVRQGDRLIVHLINGIDDIAAIEAVQSPKPLAQPNPPLPRRAGFIPVMPGMHHRATGRTNLHFHGAAVPPVAPQDEVLKRCADPAAGPQDCGQRALTYRYDIPGDMPPGLYWYHPHIHGETETQVEMGLSGALVVEGADDDARKGAGMTDRVLIVRDHLDPDDAAPVPVPVPVSGAAAMSHVPLPHPAKVAAKIDVADEVQCSDPDEAGSLSLNGAVVAEGTSTDEELAAFAIPAGQTQLWRLVNASADSYLNLALVDDTGAPLPVAIVARDAVPPVDDAGRLLGPEQASAPLLVPPAGRIEFLVAAPAPGAKAYLVSRAVDTGCAGDAVPERRLAVVTAAPGDALAWPAPAIPAGSKASISDFYIGLLARKADRTRTIAFTEYPRPGQEDSTDFYMTEIKPGAVMTPFRMDGPPTMTAPAGSVEEWDIENWTRELHAFHMHQVHFRVLSVDGTALRDAPLLDVVSIPYARPASARPGAPLQPGHVRIKLVFPPELAGDIPFHCHLMEHEDNGMMGVIRIVPKQSAALPPGADWAGLARLRDPPVCRANN